MMTYLRLAAGIPAVAPAIVAVLAGALVAIADFGLAAGFPLGYALIAYVIWVLSNYFFEVLEHKAIGRGDWPVLAIETIAGRRQQLGIVFGLVLAAGGLVYWALVATLGRPLGVAFLGLLVALLPASLAMLALTHNPVKAANPLLLLDAAVSMRVGYGVAFGVGVVAAVLIRLAVMRHGFVDAALAAYAFLSFSYVIGAVVYAHRLALGVRAPRSPEALAALEQERLNRERASALDHAYGMASRGNTRGGLAYVEAYVEGERDSLAARTWMFDRMTQWQDPGPALAFGRDLIARLGDSAPAQSAKLELRCALLEDALEGRGEG